MAYSKHYSDDNYAVFKNKLPRANDSCAEFMWKKKSKFIIGHRSAS